MNLEEKLIFLMFEDEHITQEEFCFSLISKLNYIHFILSLDENEISALKWICKSN